MPKILLYKTRFIACTFRDIDFSNSDISLFYVDDNLTRIKECYELCKVLGIKIEAILANSGCIPFLNETFDAVYASLEAGEDFKSLNRVSRVVKEPLMANAQFKTPEIYI